MKKLCILLALLAPITQANENEVLKGTWKVGYTKVDVDDIAQDFTGVSVGYERDNWFAYYAQTSADIVANVELDFNVLAVGYKHIFNEDETNSDKQNNFYGKIGVAYKKLEAALGNTGLKVSDSQTKGMVGIGYEMLRKDKLGFFAEILREDADAKTFRFGATYGF
ncbi:porin family protein [bacterium]|nr:porin family protein [bacterium]